MSPRFDGAEVRPPAHLAPLVERYVGYRYEGVPAGTHLGLPSRHLTVVISLGPPTRLARMADPAQAPASYAALAGGLHTRPAVIAHDGDLCGVQLMLTPRGARSLLGVPAGELGPQVIELDHLLAAGELIDRMGEAHGWRARFAVLDEVLTRRLDQIAAPQVELDHAWRRIAACHGAVRVADLAADVGWSRRHLTERFTREYGLTPKEAARVMRFERSRRLLQRHDRPTLASVAAACGYYDQAHLAREWNDLAGCPPSTWLADEELPFLQAETGPGGQDSPA
jgi:AraC-like DNA-binding protein